MSNLNSSVSTIPTSFSPEGWHRARCIGFVQLGTIFVANSKWQPQIRLTWELPYDMRAFNPQQPRELRPKHISAEFASNLYGKSHLKKYIEQWLGTEALEEIAQRQKNNQGFDPYMLVGTICQIRITHRKNPNTQAWYEDVSNIHRIMSQEVINAMPPQISDGKVLTFDDWQDSVFSSLPEYVKNKIRGSKEYRAMFGSDDYTDLPPTFSAPENDRPPF